MVGALPEDDGEVARPPPGGALPIISLCRWLINISPSCHLMAHDPSPVNTSHSVHHVSSPLRDNGVKILSKRELQRNSVCPHEGVLPHCAIGHKPLIPSNIVPLMEGELAIVDKRRISGGEIEIGHLIGDVKGKTVLMVDDMISTAGTVCGAAELCKEHGAERILLSATHGVLCGPAIQRLAESPVDEVVVTDTIPISQEKLDNLSKLKVLSISALIGEAIHRIHNNESVSSLFMKS